MKVRTGSLKYKQNWNMFRQTYQEKRERPQNKWSQKWERSFNWHIEIQRIISDYYKQLYANKIDNLKNVDKFLETYSLPSLNQGKIENMNRLITSNETE